MNLLNYINGNKKGKEAYRLEKEAMQNPFLSEAMDGFEMVDDKHAERLNDIYSIINKKAEETKKKPFPVRQLVAACISILIISSVAILFMQDNKESMTLAENNADAELIEIYVPTSAYEQNIAIIAQNNTSQFRQYQSEINVSNLKGPMLDQNLAKANVNESMIITDSNDPIDIFMPKEDLHTEMAMAENSYPDDTPKTSAKMMLRSASPAKNGVASDIPSIEPQCGFEEYEKYIKKNCQLNTQTSVIFDTNDDGMPLNIKVLEGKDASTNKEVIRLIKEGSKWTPSQSKIRYTIKP